MLTYTLQTVSKISLVTWTDMWHCLRKIIPDIYYVLKVLLCCPTVSEFFWTRWFHKSFPFSQMYPNSSVKEKNSSGLPKFMLLTVFNFRSRKTIALFYDQTFCSQELKQNNYIFPPRSPDSHFNGLIKYKNWNVRKRFEVLLST